MNRRVAIVSAVRTPIGRFMGGLSSLEAPELGGIVINEALRRAGLKGNEIDEVIMGNVLQGGEGQGPARQAAIKGGVSPNTPAFAVNMVCGSGLKAVMLGANSILTGESKIVVAGGMESMSNAPFALKNMRKGQKYGDTSVIDLMIYDGLQDAFSGLHMGNLAEYTAKKAGLTREELDEFSFSSHQKAIKAIDSGAFKEEIIPVEVKGRKGEVKVIDTDEGPRRDTSLEKLAKLPPAFEKNGMVTAGNSSTLNDGAAAVVLMSEEEAKARGLKPLAIIEGYASGAVEPKELFFAPINGVRKLMKILEIDSIDAFDLIEINEAFAAQTLADGKELGFDWTKVNVHGGAIALGHPIGASGTRILVTLIYAMQKYNAYRGLATLCIGGGMAVAMSIIRPK